MSKPWHPAASALFFIVIGLVVGVAASPNHPKEFSSDCRHVLDLSRDQTERAYAIARYAVEDRLGDVTALGNMQGELKMMRNNITPRSIAQSRCENGN